MNLTSDLDKFTRVLLEDRAISALLRMGRPLRTAELIQAMGEGLQINRELVRSELSESQRIVASERRWDLASRLDVSGRTLDGIIENLFRNCERPLPLQYIVREVGLAKSTRPDAVARTVEKFLRDREKFVEVASNVFALDDWIIDAPLEDEDVIVVENGLDREEGFRELAARDLPSPDGASEVDWLIVVLTHVARPVSHRVLEFIRWRQFRGAYDPTELLITLWEDARLVLLAGGYVCTREQARELAREASRRAAELESGSGLAGGVLDVDALLSKTVPEEREVRLRRDEIEEVAAQIAASRLPVSVFRLCSDIFEIDPGDEAFVPTVRALIRALDADSHFQKVGRDRYLIAESIPQYVYQMPESLRPVHLDVRTMQDERIDVELDDDGLDGDLVEMVHSPDWEEAGEEGEVVRFNAPDASLAEISWPLNILHLRAGTLKVRKKDETLFPGEANIARLLLVDASGQETAAWFSRETMLIYDLKHWYDQQNPRPGQVLKLRKSDQPERLALEISGTEPMLVIEPSRMGDLDTMAEDAERRQLSVLDVLTTLMYDHSRGAQFVTLWHEVNVVRRTTKRLVASVLSSYHCFYPRRQGNRWDWRLDASKIDQGFKRNKRKNVRK